MSGWETKIQTGNPQMDQATVEQHRQAAQAQGMVLDVQPMPGGGFYVRAMPAPAQQAPGYGAPGGYGAAPQGYGAAPQGYGAAPQGYGAAPQGYDAQAHAFQPPPGAQMAGAGGVVVGGPGAAVGGFAQPLAPDRLKHIRKVYTLLSGAAFLAIALGFLVLNVGGTEMMRDEHHHKVAVPAIVAAMLSNPGLLYGSFALLFISTLGASAVTKVKGLNVAALFFVAALMGLQLAPMVFVAQYYGAIGDTMSANPVRDTFVVVGAMFFGITGYVYVARKDFSYLAGILSMGGMVLFAACMLTFVFNTEVFSLAVATVGAIFGMGMLLYRTSVIFSGSMDDPVADALGVLITLRNLFMFVLRIMMRSRR